MSKILAYCPTYSPNQEATNHYPRSYERMTNIAIEKRINSLGTNSREKPFIYFDAIDSVCNVRPDIKLVVADARSTDSIREELKKHHAASDETYILALYQEKLSQWKLLNDVWKRFSSEETEFLVYTSSDILWGPDWIAEAEKEFAKDPTLQIIFPCVNNGDPNLPCQVVPSARDMDMIEPPYQHAARAPCLNSYAFIMRREFLDTYGGYMTAYRNCHSESFLFYQCEAMGGKMRLAPRCWTFHHSGVDAWAGEGGLYNYTHEHEYFDAMMDKIQIARMNGKMTVDFLKTVLYSAPTA